MILFARMLALLPFTVNVSGRKHHLICSMGTFFSRSLPEKITYRGADIRLRNHSKAAIIAYATHNFFNDFRYSALGRYMSTNLHPGDFFVDIGANLGGYSFLAKRMGAEVCAFEPFTELNSFLSDNEQAFGQCVPVALSDVDTESMFFVSDRNIGGSSLVESAASWENSGYSRKDEVQVRRFDSYFAKEIQNRRIIDLVKVDVEGNEEKTVRGMEAALEKKLVRAIWCEVRGPLSDRNANSYRPVCEFLASHGFSVFRGSDQEPFDWRHADPQELPQFFDLLFELKK